MKDAPLPKTLHPGEDTPVNMLAAQGMQISRRAFLHSSVVAVSGLALAGCVNSMFTRGDVEIVDRTITIPNLPQAFKGKRIALLSDLHSSPFMTLNELRSVVRKTNELGADMIVMPGDFVTSHRNEIPPFVEAISELRAPLGVYASTGNHDYYCDVDLVTQGIEEAGVKMLRNESAKISLGGESIHVLGVDDEDYDEIANYNEGKHAPHVEAAFRGIPERSVTVLLCHKPYHFEDYAKANVSLQLSGHTHGGQIVFGRIGRSVLSLSSVASRFVEGLYSPSSESSNSQLYVSRGIGVVGLPLRLNCPPEITRITLA